MLREAFDRGRRAGLPALHDARRRRASASPGWRPSSSASSRRRRVVRGRCLSYGDGITYWPVVEVVKQLRPTSASWSRPSPPLGALLGSDERATAEEIACAVRKLLEAGRARTAARRRLRRPALGRADVPRPGRARRRLARDAPILLLCLARPELLDADRAGAAEAERHHGAARAARRGRDATQLARRALGGATLDAGAARARSCRRRRATRCSSRRWWRWSATRSDGDVPVPPTIQALLAARLDQLAAAERAVLARGVSRGPGLPPRRGRRRSSPTRRSRAQLRRSCARSCVRPDRRDAARRRRLPVPPPPDPRRRLRGAPEGDARGAARALRRLARQARRRLVELDEIVGYHLEQATRYRAGARSADGARARGRGACRRTASRRGLSGRFRHNDVRASASLLRARPGPATSPGHAPSSKSGGWSRRSMGKAGELASSAVRLDELAVPRAAAADDRLVPRCTDSLSARRSSSF